MRRSAKGDYFLREPMEPMPVENIVSFDWKSVEKYINEHGVTNKTGDAWKEAENAKKAELIIPEGK